MTTKKIIMVISGILALFLTITIAFALVRIILPNTFGTLPYRHWMMGNGDYYQENIEYKSSDIIQSDIANSQPDANVDIQNNTITYTSSDIDIVIVGGPEEADEKFVIYDLINPTIYVPLNATVTIEFANADEGMPHDFVITDSQPPFSYMAMMFSGHIYPDSAIGLLPQAANDVYPVANTTFEANQAGEYYYLCLYPGHAAQGMYGKIIIG